MDEKNEKSVKNRFSQARRSYLWDGTWFGAEMASGDFQIEYFLGQVEFSCKAKSTGLKRGPCLAFLSALFFCGRKHLVA